MVYGHCLVTLPVTMNETLTWLSSLPILICRNRSGGDRIALGIPPTPTPRSPPNPGDLGPRHYHSRDTVRRPRSLTNNDTFHKTFWLNMTKGKMKLDAQFAQSERVNYYASSPRPSPAVGSRGCRNYGSPHLRTWRYQGSSTTKFVTG